MNVDTRIRDLQDSVPREDAEAVLEPVVGPHGSEWFGDRQHYRADCQQLQKAIKDRWPMETDFRHRLLDRLMLMVENSDKERHILSAARALASLDRDNVAAKTGGGNASATAAVQVNVNTGNVIDDLHERIDASKTPG
ncbi:hypothetical protein LCGC14_0298360 [marine sediment metagenome]|uniref:Uncharacterized protein n=1 Tax=marine sediment metagenome TaxID=412755 RepID=A0A0F9WCN6_9ZZZZ